MSDRFWQAIDIKFPEGRDPWAIAKDVESIIEAVYGKAWSQTDVKRSATTKSRVSFQAPDLTTLRDNTRAHGADLRSITFFVSYWDGSAHLSVYGYVWIEDGLTEMVELDTNGPLRAEIERIVLGVERMVNGLAKRKNWSDAKVVVDPMEISSDAEGKTRTTRTELISPADGLRPRLRRWVIRNRDNLIIGLGGGFLVTALWGTLQAVGVIPTGGN